MNEIEDRVVPRLDADVFRRLEAARPEVNWLARIWPLGFLLQLPPQANIVVAGAYRGRVMGLLATLYPDYARLVGFEPQQAAREEALRRLPMGAEVLPFGLGISAGSFLMQEYGAEYATFVQGPERPGGTDTGVGVLREAVGAFDELGLERIDVLVLNIEGYEWTLLPHLIKADLFRSGRIRRLVLQTHAGGGEWQFPRIASTIEQTHKRVFDELPAWGYWQWSGA